MSPRVRLVRALCVVALFLSGVGVAGAQGAFVAEGLGRGTVAVEGGWAFHTGDDLAWASPGFEDAGWERVEVARPWGDQGHWAYAGRAWYRRWMEFKDLKDVGEVAVYVPDTSCAYEVYWNGRLVGRTDGMPAATMVNSSGAKVFRLGRPERGVLAFRASTTPLDSLIAGNETGLMAVPRVGSMEAVGDLAEKERARLVRSRLLTIAQIVIYGQLSFLALMVWLRFRERKVLFWMFAFLLSATLWVSLDYTLFPWMLDSPAAATTFYGSTFHSLEDVALWFLLLYLLELDRLPKLVKWTKVLAWITVGAAIADSLLYSMPQRDAHTLLFEVLDAVATVAFSTPAVFPFVLIALAFRKRMNPARKLVAVAAFLADIYFVVHHTAVQGERFTHWTFGDRMMKPMFAVGGVEATMPAVLSLLLVCAIVYALYNYMLEQGQKQGVMLEEYRNARAVQQVLIPENAPEIPGYLIRSVYKPYGEVGGDFFQVIPIAEGGVLIVIGDVSGKGMPAAMTVSLLVGTIRTLAHYTQRPGEMMAAMNQRLIGRSHGGFTTCLVLRADPDGRLTMSNAGHISPYLAGKELTLETGLPLGIVWSPSYEETVFSMGVGEQLMLVTDGVVEAREASGALLGFERTAGMSGLSAEEVAEAAQGFGQDDDITVLTLTRLS